MNWRFWMKICVNNSIEDDKQVSLTPALLNRDNENDGCFQAIICRCSIFTSLIISDHSF